MKQAATAPPGSEPARPGPFGPAWALLPRGQRLLSVTAETPAGHALERMEEHGYGQLPVTRDAGGAAEVVGVFSWRSFCRASLDLSHSRKLDPLAIPVEEFLDPAVFLDRETFIDTATDWSACDHVLVGTPRHVEGLLTLGDAFGRLNDFAEAFVLIYEVETELRDTIERVAGDRLDAWLETLQRPERGRPVRALTDASFADYGQVIASQDRWPDFEPVFARQRELVVADLDAVNGLRNVVFHFRRTVTNRDTDRLRRFRDKLRRGRTLLGARNAPAAAPREPG